MAARLERITLAIEDMAAAVAFDDAGVRIAEPEGNTHELIAE